MFAEIDEGEEDRVIAVKKFVIGMAGVLVKELILVELATMEKLPAESILRLVKVICPLTVVPDTVPCIVPEGVKAMLII